MFLSEQQLCIASMYFIYPLLSKKGKGMDLGCFTTLESENVRKQVLNLDLLSMNLIIISTVIV